MEPALGVQFDGPHAGDWHAVAAVTVESATVRSLPTYDFSESLARLLIREKSRFAHRFLPPQAVPRCVIEFRAFYCVLCKVQSPVTIM
jgi:hypothetical protein